MEDHTRHLLPLVASLATDLISTELKYQKEVAANQRFVQDSYGTLKEMEDSLVAERHKSEVQGVELKKLLERLHSTNGSNIDDGSAVREGMTFQIQDIVHGHDALYWFDQANKRKKEKDSWKEKAEEYKLKAESNDVHNAIKGINNWGDIKP